ncbi:MAG TPA: hypothetical protein VER33_21235 [Polyangiaceae bacterium]|nr:hypothetical protein [Polyangiaceae bacterium]
MAKVATAHTHDCAALFNSLLELSWKGGAARVGELRARRQPRACRDRRGAFFLRACASNTESESPYFDMWSKMGVALCEPDVFAREILATIRQRRRAHVMGGGLFRMLTLANAITPTAAGAIGLRRFAKRIKEHRPG